MDQLVIQRKALQEAASVYKERALRGLEEYDDDNVLQDILDGGEQAQNMVGLNKDKVQLNDEELGLMMYSFMEIQEEKLDKNE